MGRSSLPSSTPCLSPDCRGTFELQDLVEGAGARPSTPSRRGPLRTGVSLRYAMCGLGEKAERALRARGGRAEPPLEAPSSVLPSPTKSITEAIMAAPLVLSSDDLLTLAQSGGDEAGNGGSTATPTRMGPPRARSSDAMPDPVRRHAGPDVDTHRRRCRAYVSCLSPRPVSVFVISCACLAAPLTPPALTSYVARCRMRPLVRTWPSRATACTSSCCGRTSGASTWLGVGLTCTLGSKPIADSPPCPATHCSRPLS